MIRQVLCDTDYDPTHHSPCTSNDKEYCQIDTYSEHSNCGISCGITKAALDYEPQIRKLLILLTPVHAWCCSKDMNPSPGHQNMFQVVDKSL